MHVKTNIEHSTIQIIALAMCPLLFVVSTLNEAVFFVCGTIFCLIISQLFLMLFNKYLNNNVKAMLTAIISSLLVTVAMLLVKENTDKTLPENSYFIVFSTTIISAEFIYFRNKAIVKHYLFRVLKIMVAFALITAVYACVKEFLAFGTIYEKQLFKFQGVKFCRMMTFNLILLASVCAGFDSIVRMIEKSRETKNMMYQKYVKIIRSEKAFQYDILRREKLLSNDIEVNKINKVDSEKLTQKQSENEAIESVSEAINDEAELVEPKVDDMTNKDKSEENGDSESVAKASKKKKNKGDKK